VTFDQAVKLSTIDTVWRVNDGGGVEWSYDHNASRMPGTKAPTDRPDGKFVDPNYAGIYKDWRPYKGRDVITMLGDLVRNRLPPERGGTALLIA